MTTSKFEAAPGDLAEPMARRRERVLERPGGTLALAARKAALRPWDRYQAERFARTPEGRESQALLTRLHGSQEGRTGVVVCNGPSLNRTDLDLIGDHPYILMNRGYLLGDRLAGNPTVVCVAADLVLSQYGDEISQIPAPLLLSTHHRSIIPEREDVAFVHPERRWLFASEIGTTLHIGYTVTFWALQMAFHLGWKKCIIVGMDHRYDQTGDPTKEVQTKGQDHNHFDPNYFQDGAKWLLPALEMNEYSYRLVRSAYEAHGREVVDCTVDGACRVFRRSDLSLELAI